MLQRLFELESRVPPWLRPTFRGAAFIFGMGSGVAGRLVVFTILAILALLAGAIRGVALFLGLLAVTVLAGAAAGMIHGMLRPMERWGALGTWLRWTVANLGFILTFALLTPWGPFTPRDGVFCALAAGVAGLGAGVILLLDDRRPDRPSPGKYQRIQGHARLWAAAARARARMLARLADQVR